jgi:ribonuclease P protein component
VSACAARTDGTSSSDAVSGAASASRISGLAPKRFEAVFRDGRRVGGRYCRLAALSHGQGNVGFAVPRKLGSQPRRNRVRRRFREAIRLQSGRIDPRLDYIAILYPSALEATLPEIEKEVSELLEKMKERWDGDLESS